jgi:hypothetical protein
LPGGCKALKAEHIFGDEILRKTVWPPEWTAEQIMEAIKQAWHNQIIKKQRPGTNVFGIKGKTKNNIEIEMYVEFLANNKIKLKTAYPYFKGFSQL